MLLEVSVLGALIYGAHRAISKRKGMTPDREIIYRTALNSIKDPASLKELAKVFRSEGLSLQADMLEKRAKLRELPKETKDARKEAFRKGMASTDPIGIRKLADSFENEGATGAAEALRTYANSLEVAHANSPAVAPPAPAPPVEHKEGATT